MVDVYNAFSIRACGVNGRMQDKASDIDAETRRARINQITLKREKKRIKYDTESANGSG